MNTYKFLLYNGSEFIDITSLVETNANIQDKLDKTLDFGSIRIPHAKATYTNMSGLDFSQVIKPWTPLLIDINNGYEQYRMFTTDCTRSIIGKGTTKRYTHEINFIEASKVLQSKPIPDFTITQPKGAVFTGLYYADLKEENEEINNTLETLGFTTINQSTNTSLIQSNVLKEAGREYDIYYNTKIINSQYNYRFATITRISGETEVEFSFFANDVEIDGTKKTIYISPANYSTNWLGQSNLEPSETSYANSFKYTPASSNTTITVKARTIGLYQGTNSQGTPFSQSDEVTLQFFNLTLSTGTTEATEETYLADAVDKVLNMFNLTYGSTYFLSESTRAEIKDVVAPEETYQSYTAWDALERLADFVNAIPEVGLGSFNEVSFTFLDEESDLDYDLSDYTEESQSIVFDDYTSGYEINASNVIEEDALKNVKIEPYIGGWLTARTNSDTVQQLRESNSAFKTRQNIYKIYKVYIKGIGVQVTINDSTYTSIYGNNGTTVLNGTYWDISDLVVESQRWNALEDGTANSNDLERLNKDTKGNHIHYTQGSKYIQGLAHKTQYLSNFLGTADAPRALMETIMKAAAIKLQDSGYHVRLAIAGNPEIAIVGSDPKHPVFKGVYAQIHYIPMANVRTTIYRHDTFDRGVDTIKYFNEQDKINDAENLGKYAKKTINKLGNTIYMVSGRARDYKSIPKLGYKTTDGKIITSRNMNLNKNLVTYDLELSKDFLNQSSFIRVNSAYRQYEVPDTDIVHRQDKYQEYVVLTKDRTSILPVQSNLSQYGKWFMWGNFQTTDSNYITSPISYGKFTATKTLGSTEENNVEAFDLPINGYAMGNTINLQFEAEDNYSMGPNIYADELGDDEDPYRLQKWAGYTNRFGKLHSFDLELRQKGTQVADIDLQTDSDAYPKLVNDSFETYDEVLFSLDDYIPYKDAREKYGMNIQFPIISAQSDIRVYPGFAKYNSMIAYKDSVNIKFGLMTNNNYFPGINENKVDTTRISITTDYTAEPQYDSTNGIYGTLFEPFVEANQTVYGYVLFEGETKELILAVKEEFENTDDFGVYHQFSPIYSVHKKTLNNRLIPNEPALRLVTFVENGGSTVQDVSVINGTNVSEPSILREGYTLNGWFNNISLLEQYRFDFNTLVTSNLTLYAKWDIVPVEGQVWERVYTSTYDYTIYPEVQSYTCPTDYTSLLPNPELYAEGYTINVAPYRYCDPGQEICFENPITMTYFNVCEQRQYRVVQG